MKTLPEGQDLKQRREEALRLCHRMDELTEGYNGIHGFLGESFCETYVGMVRTPRGTKDVDGYIGEKSVQVKFKWVTEENFATRYIAIGPKTDFDWLIVVCAEDGDAEVRLFGIWESGAVFELRDRPPQNRVKLRELREIPQVEGFKIAQTLIYSHCENHQQS